MRHATIVHPRLLEALVAGGFFPFTATIQAPTRVSGTAGGETSTWATVPGLEAIPATKDVTGGVEQRGPEMIVEEIFTQGPAGRLLGPDRREHALPARRRHHLGRFRRRL